MRTDNFLRNCYKGKQGNGAEGSKQRFLIDQDCMLMETIHVLQRGAGVGGINGSLFLIVLTPNSLSSLK